MVFSRHAWLGSPADQLQEPRTFYAPETASPRAEPDLVENEDGALFVDVSDGCGSNKGSGWNFSLYLTGRDTRTPAQIVAFKLENLSRALMSFEDFIDPSVFADLAGSLRTVLAAVHALESSGSRADRDAALAALEELGSTVDANPAAFDDAAARRNVSGELIARAVSALFILPKVPTTGGPLITEFPLPTPQRVPFGMGTGPDGNIWFSEYARRMIGRMTPSGDLTEFPLPPPEGPNPLYSLPAGSAVGSDGRIWFSEDFSHRVGAITTAGEITYYPLPLTGRGTTSPLPGPDGNLWILALKGASNVFFRMTTTGTITGEFPLPSSFDIAWTPTFGPDGNLWFGTGYGPNNVRGRLIGRMTLAGAVTEFPVPTPDSAPSCPVAGPDGNIWFTENAASRIGRLTPSSGLVTEFPIPSPNSHPFWTAIGPDGNVWFYDEANSNLDRISPNGTITEYHVSAPSGSAVLGMTTGPDGKLWFAEPGPNKIGRLSQ